MFTSSYHNMLRVSLRAMTCLMFMFGHASASKIFVMGMPKSEVESNGTQKVFSSPPLCMRTSFYGRDGNRLITLANAIWRAKSNRTATRFN